MKVAGLVAEYNPFHNGHVHHLSETRRLSGADYVVVVMSGNYVQRGTPAVIDKYERARMALHGGADLVLELPALFSTASAEVFANAAVSLLYQLGVVDAMGFGAEYTDLPTLKRIAEVLNHEPESLSRDIRDALRAKGYRQPFEAPTNQIFITLSRQQAKDLSDKIGMSFWENAAELLFRRRDRESG